MLYSKVQVRGLRRLERRLPHDDYTESAVSDWRWAIFGFGLIALAVLSVYVIKKISDKER
jgi:hypothetical protein